MNEANEVSDLDLVSTDDLMHELQARFDAGAIMLATSVDKNMEADRSSWWGGVAAVGLTELLRQRVVTAWFNTLDQDDEGEHEFIV